MSPAITAIAAALHRLATSTDCELREPGGLVHEVVGLVPPRTWGDLRGLARRLAHRWGWTGRDGVARALALMVGAHGCAT